MRSAVLNENREFQRVYRRGRSYVSPVLVTCVLPRRSGGIRIGITTSKKAGGAVQRARARRVIREAWRAQQLVLPQNADLVFVARSATAGVRMQKVEKAMRAHLSAAGFVR